MGDLQLSADSPGLPAARARSDTSLGRSARALRSGIFFAVFFGYMICVMGPGQRLFLWPATILFPHRRRAMVRAWLRAHARVTLTLARVLAGVRVSVHGALPGEACIVVMNHQSVLDIPIGLTLVTGPYPLIPTRDRYRRGIPGISPLVRIARFPIVSQKRTIPRPELAALTDAADQVARGEQSYLIFPEGHRSRDGSIGPFMRTGLRLVLSRARRPIYCIIADGMSHARTFAETASRFAGTRVRITILGPFPPPDDSAVDACIDSLRDRMRTALTELRAARLADRPHAFHPDG